ncbi:MAG: outer membrane protein assembly factor BamC [Pseudomonadota bacterium]|nr:outer membrane protein assembly factor BamC [Pseudomonadota bacterium]
MTRSLQFSVLAAATALAVSLTGCSSLDSLMSGDKIDYRTSSGTGKSAGLEVPPDLTQLSRDSRYQLNASGSVSANDFQKATPNANALPTTAVAVAPAAAGDVRIERLGNDRWIHTTLTPEQVWPQVQAFWKERGFVIVEDTPAAGVMETDWAENRAKLPQDFVRASIGKVFDGAYSTGELDKFRTRVERAGAGSDIFITHRGMIEVYTGERRDSTIWQPRQPDPQLEGEFLSRLMLKMGGTEEAAKSAIAAGTSTASPGTAGTPGGPARARLLADQPTPTLQVDDGFDRAWRRVGVALDRSGFTVEDRDRTQGIYYVRYIDPKFAGKDEPNLISKLFSFGKKDDSAPARYRVAVKGAGDQSTVTVQNGTGAPETGDAGKRIATMLLDDLK